MTLVAVLCVRPHTLEQFRAFERQAAGIMSHYGGRIERTVVIPPAAPEQLLREVHIATFPDAEAFDRYRADPRLSALASVREQCVISTELWIGEDGPDYALAVEPTS
jgi:hypothetical protein